MATVVVLSADRVMQLINAGIIDGTINANGELILSKPDGTTINVGNIKTHGQLLDLNEDDHPQYALSDGSRGEFATVTQGQKADGARPNINAAINLFGADEDQVEVVTINTDGSDPAFWPNLVEYWFQDNDGLPPRRCFYVNETGEIRVAPSRWNTVALRVFAKEFPNNPTAARSTTVPVVEFMDDRTNRNSLRAWMGNGDLYRRGVRMSENVVLNETDPVPPNTPPNTVIIRVAE